MSWTFHLKRPAMSARLRERRGGAGSASGEGAIGSICLIGRALSPSIRANPPNECACGVEDLHEHGVLGLARRGYPYFERMVAVDDLVNGRAGIEPREQRPDVAGRAERIACALDE